MEVQKVLDLLVVYLGIWSFDRKAAFLLFYFLPKLLDSSWNNALSFVLLVDLSIVNFVFSCHSVRFAWPCLSVSEDCGTIALDGGINELVDVAFLIAHLLCVILIEQIIEFVALIHASIFKKIGTYDWSVECHHSTVWDSLNHHDLFKFHS